MLGKTWVHSYLLQQRERVLTDVGRLVDVRMVRDSGGAGHDLKLYCFEFEGHSPPFKTLFCHIPLQHLTNLPRGHRDHRDRGDGV